ncbi:unnamed protein product [Leptosia nina]|uniref:Eclosion hormone n=1 Tax=Leptosia nina TaxID=320188 RepID=A0AAV1JE45_9NEOP
MEIPHGFYHASLSKVFQATYKSSGIHPIFSQFILKYSTTKPSKMAAKISAVFTILIISMAVLIQANPAIVTGYDQLELCIENCAQCKKMLGAWFDGPLCAESCIKFKGKLIPDCEDFASIAPFINKL